MKLTRFIADVLVVLGLCVLPSNGGAVVERPRQVQLSAWPEGPGNLISPQQPDNDLQNILSSISVSRIQATVEKLASFGTRHTLSSQTDPVRGIGAARDWIAAELRSYGGRLNVTVPSYIQQRASGIPSPTRISDIVARLEGASEPNRVYVVSGHYDSRNSNGSDGVGDAPGADDDASGVAVAMELARVMAQRRPAATIIFAAVAGEEQGLYGAAFLADTLRNASADVQGMFTNDIVGSPKADDGFLDPTSIRLFAQGIPASETADQIALRAQIGGENDSPARALARFSAEVARQEVTGMNVRIIYRLDRYLRGGDHRPFLERGFPAARFTEPNEDYAHQHQNVRVEGGQQFGDLPEFCDFEYISRVAKVNAATIWSLAQAPGTPKSVTISTSGLTNDSTFRWAANPSAGLAGYEIVWRATNEPTWTNVVSVGRVTTATVNLSKDNVIFGVRAVGTNGYRSPAALPFPG